MLEVGRTRATQDNKVAAIVKEAETAEYDTKTWDKGIALIGGAGAAEAENTRFKVKGDAKAVQI